MSSISRLESIYTDLEKEHRRVMKLMDRLRAQATVTDLLPLLDELRTLLIIHFAREQLPDGFYEALGELAEPRRGELQDLIDEHASILSDLNGMLEQARQAGAGDQDELLNRVSALLQQLDGHEQKEHQFAVDILGAKAD
ncbi:MAG: hemerythrin domain-containing protein, partial [Gammaproteobacteria bacterium]|nr:hemerythrin domain-containing protein [Gammaproteobacteria bacterium]